MKIDEDRDFQKLVKIGQHSKILFFNSTTSNEQIFTVLCDQTLPVWVHPTCLWALELLSYSPWQTAIESKFDTRLTKKILRLTENFFSASNQKILKEIVEILTVLKFFLLAPNKISVQLLPCPAPSSMLTWWCIKLEQYCDWNFGLFLRPSFLIWLLAPRRYCQTLCKWHFDRENPKKFSYKIIFIYRIQVEIWRPGPEAPHNFWVEFCLLFFQSKLLF